MELGDSKIVKKFRRLLAECEEGHVYKGKILDFIKVDYVPKERQATGMIITGDTGTHRVEFTSGPKEYIKNASPFRVGDEILVLGRENKFKSNATLPSIILIPEEESVVLSKEHSEHKLHGWVDHVQAVFFLLAIILGIIYWFGDLIFIAVFGIIHPYPPIITLSGAGACLLFLGIVLLDIYSRYDLQERTIRRDSETWTLFNDEINQRFDGFT